MTEAHVWVLCFRLHCSSYVFRHYQLSAFTQLENMTGSAMNAPKDFRGAWDGAKVVMVKASMDITREGRLIQPLKRITLTFVQVGRILHLFLTSSRIVKMF